MEEKCPLGEHSKIEVLCEKFCSEIQEMKGVNEKQWEVIAKKASTSSVKWGVVVFVMLMLATVGFLWNVQRENRNEIIGELKSIQALIVDEDGLRDKVKALGWKLDVLEKQARKNNTEPKKQGHGK